EFLTHYRGVERRISREIETIFDNKKHSRSISDYSYLDNVLGYDYKSSTYNLKEYSLAEINSWADKVKGKYVDSYDYDVETLNQVALSEDMNYFTQGNIFFKQQKFFEAYTAFDMVKNKEKFSSLSYGMAYTFYMAFQANQKELKIYLENKL